MVQVVAPKSAAPSKFPARVTIAPIFDVRQEFKGIVVTYADISAQKAAEEVLIQTAQQHSIAVELGLLALMSDDLETLLAKLSDDILEVIGADLCEVLEISPAGEQVRVRYRKAAIGVALDSPNHAEWRAIEAGSQLEFLRQHRAGVVSEDYSSEKRFRAEPTVMEGGFQSGMSLLIGTWDKPYGILNVYFRGCSKTQSTRIDFLQTLASIVGSFVQRQQAMQRWRALFENTLDAILLTNDSGRYVDANPAACRLLGYSHRELTSLSVRDLYPKELAAAFDDSWQRFIKVGRDTGEAKLVGRDGQEVHVEYRAVANVLPGLHLSGLTDVTARRSSEALIREQQHHLAHVQRTAIMGQMAAVLAHEINQPLGAISNLTGGQLLALEENNASMDELRESLQQVIGQSLRAGEIVRRLRRFVSQSRGVARTVDLNQVIEETVRLVNNDFTLRNTSIRIELVNESLWVQADAIQIQQVLINLLKNSAEAMESVGSPNKRIGIRSWSENAHVVVSVTDSGPGLTEAQARHAFEPYYTTKDDGLGMGLCISRSILDQHRGTIMADATYRDGARFIIRLPRFTGDIHTALSRDASMLQS